MKTKKVLDNTKLGMLVIAGILFLVFTLYMIGKNQNLFGSTFSVIAVVDNVSGLVPGNNVRFKGMNVGTVKSIQMENDSSIYISLLIHNNMKPFIKKNVLTTINTDGLMGNKIIQIVSQPGFADNISEGDTIYAQRGIDTDELLHKLESTGGHLEKTFSNLASVAEKLNNSQELWKLLSDSNMTEEIKLSINQIRIAGTNAAAMAKSGKSMISSLEKGDGLVNKVFKDSVMAENFAKSIEHLVDVSQQATEIAMEIKHILSDLESGKGTAGLVLQDSAVRESIRNIVINVEESTVGLNENMEALKHSFLLRGYFRKQEKQQRRDAKINPSN
ncbi:MlaD family protein [Cecembia rubra]|uniref:Phospholipid/cholesterol/gamma-HCH transport system substrate-binding protein n=1 Tax=Cecembia rubra TaxID=1485585 RepID=A0A2P8EDH3_9BACT|nr:MlaD family protein [Cecembia rubra]PSL07536.1 phospholipid/cholesterol/gamma-HCH transport system substrate-binding protein [Cecembia rubra]